MVREKMNKKAASRSTTTVHQTEVPVPPIVGSKKFPTNDIPEIFSVHHISQYLLNSVFMLVPGCESSLTDVSTEKPEERGEQYFRGGHVQDMFDTVKSIHHFIKATTFSI